MSIPESFKLHEFMKAHIDSTDDEIIDAIKEEGISGLSLAGILSATLNYQANAEAFAVVESDLPEMLANMYATFQEILPVLKAEASGKIGDDSVSLIDTLQKMDKDNKLVPVSRTFQGYLYLTIKAIANMFDAEGNKIIDLV